MQKYSGKPGSRKPVTKGMLVLYGANACLWAAICALDFIWNPGDAFLRVVHILCAVIWSAAFFRWLRRYQKERRKNQKA